MVLSAVRQIVSRWVTHLSHICQKMLEGMKTPLKNMAFWWAPTLHLHCLEIRTDAS